MEISVTYKIFQLEVDGGWGHGDCLSAMFVDTDEVEEYSRFCKRMAGLLRAGVVTNPQTFCPTKHGDFILWIEEIEYGFPKASECATEEEVRKHIEYCIDMYEAFYVK